MTSMTSMTSTSSISQTQNLPRGFILGDRSGTIIKEMWLNGKMVKVTGRYFIGEGTTPIDNIQWNDGTSWKRPMSKLPIVFRELVPPFKIGIHLEFTDLRACIQTSKLFHERFLGTYIAQSFQKEGPSLIDALAPMKASMKANMIPVLQNMEELTMSNLYTYVGQSLGAREFSKVIRVLEAAHQGFFGTAQRPISNIKALLNNFSYSFREKEASEKDCIECLGGLENIYRQCDSFIHGPNRYQGDPYLQESMTGHAVDFLRQAVEKKNEQRVKFILDLDYSISKRNLVREAFNFYTNQDVYGSNPQYAKFLFKHASEHLQEHVIANFEQAFEQSEANVNFMLDVTEGIIPDGVDFGKVFLNVTRRQNLTLTKLVVSHSGDRIDQATVKAVISNLAPAKEFIAPLFSYVKSLDKSSTERCIIS